MKTSELIKLARDVFGQEPGASLLRELELDVSNTLYDESAHKVYWRIGQLDLVRRLKMLTDVSNEELVNLINQEEDN